MDDRKPLRPTVGRIGAGRTVPKKVRVRRVTGVQVRVTPVETRGLLGHDARASGGHASAARHERDEDPEACRYSPHLVLQPYPDGPTESPVVCGLNVHERHRGHHEEGQSVSYTHPRLRSRA